MKNIYLSRYSFGRDIYAVHGRYKSNDPEMMNDCCMAAYIAHGSGVLYLNQDKLSATEGDAFLINPNVPYRFVPIKDIRQIDVYLCYFSSHAVKYIQNELENAFSDAGAFFGFKCAAVHSVDTENKEIREIFIRMIDEQLSSPPCSYTILTGYLPVLLTKIFRNTKTRNFKRIYSKNKTADNAIRYIHQHMYSKISLSDIAKSLSVSPSFVCREFKRSVGMTTSQFINLLRVEKLKDILKNTDRPPRYAADFFNCNTEYIKQVFKRETGITIQEYWSLYNYKNAAVL